MPPSQSILKIRLLPGQIQHGYRLINQGEQDKFLNRGNRGATFLVATQEEHLLAQDEQLRLFVIQRQTAETHTIPEQGKHHMEGCNTVFVQSKEDALLDQIRCYLIFARYSGSAL
jgi:hypothetical protein